MKFDDVREAVAGLPIMTPAQGRVIYDHVLESEPVDILELGTASGVSAAYMAAALEELGRGSIVTYDKAQLLPGVLPEDSAFAKCPELLRYVRFERPSHTSYVWWLMREIERRSDAAGNVEPGFDFCYLDAAHDFTIDGLAVYLIERLLRPEGWLLLDDLNWCYAADHPDYDRSAMSEDEFRTPHMRVLFDVLLKQHPQFTEFRVQDGSWGWAHKAPGRPRTYSIETTQSVSGIVIDRMKRAALSARSRTAGVGHK